MDARGGPAKVAIFASGLMGMIHGTSAGNVVSTIPLTIPLIKKVGYPGRSAAATAAGGGPGRRRRLSETPPLERNGPRQWRGPLRCGEGRVNR